MNEMHSYFGNERKQTIVDVSRTSIFGHQLLVCFHSPYIKTTICIKFKPVGFTPSITTSLSSFIPTSSPCLLPLPQSRQSRDHCHRTQSTSARNTCTPHLLGLAPPSHDNFRLPPTNPRSRFRCGSRAIPSGLRHSEPVREGAVMV